MELLTIPFLNPPLQHGILRVVENRGITIFRAFIEL